MTETNSGVVPGGAPSQGERDPDERTRASVEEKFGEQNFRVLSEMRFLGKIRVVILDFCRVCLFFSEIWREIRF